MSEVVWAKLSDGNYWPAKIGNPPLGMKERARRFYVYFFGQKEHGFIKIEDCLCYLEHKTTLINAGKGATFEEAVSACETYIKHPMEADVPCTEEVEECSTCAEKQNQIETLTEQNRKLLIELDTAKSIQWDLDAKKEKIFELEADLSRAESKYQIEIEDLKQKLQEASDMNNNNSKSTQNTQSKVKRKSVKEEKEYEVESLLDHKYSGSKRMFLVKWKGYDESHNTWIIKKNLNCSKILQNYLKVNQLK